MKKNDKNRMICDMIWDIRYYNKVTKKNTCESMNDIANKGVREIKRIWNEIPEKYRTAQLMGD